MLIDLQVFNNLKTRCRNKFNNKKTVVNGIEFDSKKEAKRYKELLELSELEQIYHLRLQESYELIPKMPLDTPRVGKKGRLAYCERAVNYIADFAYIDNKGREIVEDVKGVKTPEYIIKRKLMKYRYNIEIKEI